MQMLNVLEALARFVVPLSALPPYATPWAIYFHFWQGHLVYIGQAEDSFKRTAAHRSQKDFEEVYCLAVLPDGRSHFTLIERALISYFDPRDNKFPYRVTAKNVAEMNEVFGGYGLLQGKVLPTISREAAPPLSVEQVERLWWKTNSKAHRLLLLIANSSEPVWEYDEAWPTSCLMRKTVAYIDSVAHKLCRAKTPIASSGASKNREFSMAPEMAAAFQEYAARLMAA